jgi:hypothetical protein
MAAIIFRKGGLHMEVAIDSMTIQGGVQTWDVYQGVMKRQLAARIHPFSYPLFRFIPLTCLGLPLSLPPCEVTTKKDKRIVLAYCHVHYHRSLQ